MRTILVVDDEKMILGLLSEGLESGEDRIQVLQAQNGKQAVELLGSAKVDLVITDLKMPVMDGYELLSHMGRHYRNVPVIVMTGFGSPEIARRLRQKGVVHYVEKPLDIGDLREKVQSLLSERSKGFIQGITLANFLQAVEVEQKTLTLRIRSKGRVGHLYVEKGELIDAEDGEGHAGEEAALAILCWDDAEIELMGIHNRERIIDNSLMSVLLEASKLKDEKKKTDDKGEDLLGEAIRLAEAHHLKPAQTLLVKLLKANPRNHRAWIWYSRLMVTLKTIESALVNAAKLAPKDPEVIEEVRRFKLARERKDGEEQIRRCPFCWFAMPVKSVQCPFCKAHLFIHQNFFSELGHADSKIMEGAVERYTRVISREKNVNAHYFLSVAHLNLEHWEEALNLFHKTVQLSPNQEIFSEQLKALVNHMAMGSTSNSFEKNLDGDTLDGEEKKTGFEKAKIEGKRKILVVEDSSTTRKVIVIKLTQEGYDVIEAADGLEALSRLNEEKPHLILLDIILPKMDGYKILSIVKSNAVFKDIPVIMLTSRDGLMNKVKGKLAGSAAYLTKPFDPEILVETIAKHIP